MEDTKTEKKKKNPMNGQYYTTTFNIPIWIGDRLKDEAEERGLRGMNRVLEIICTNYFLESKKRKAHNKKVKELVERGSITAKEKEELWWN